MKPLIEFHQKWQHLASPSFFIGGFLLDIVTLGRIDDLSNILIFSFYLLVSFLVFFLELVNLQISIENGQPSSAPLPNWNFRGQSLEHWINLYKDEVFHFAQGALLSGFTLFYFKSAELSSSLLFMTILLIPLIINEFNRVRELGIIIKSVFLNLTLMSFILVYTPLPFGKVGLMVFSVGILVYLIIATLLFQLFRHSKISLELIKKYWLYPFLSLAIVFYGLRLFKAIPPVPLSLEMAGIYHKVEKQYPEYKLYHERKWWRFWHSSDEYFQAREEDRLYFFGRIFAPRGFEDRIYVRWLKYDNGDWRTSDRIPLTITGGRDKGFRGYTYKDNYTPGLWRVSVETSGGLEIGRLSFEVIKDHSTRERNFQVSIDK